MIDLQAVEKTYAGSRGPVHALRATDLNIAAGEFVVISGPSGSGKSTLLLMLGGMLSPTAGRVSVDGADLYQTSAARRARFRAERVGFVFQMFHLLPYLSVLDNVRLGAANGAAAGRADALKWIERLGLGHCADRRPANLSVGERQRAAVARALIKRPALVLADEPTGNLDSDNAARVITALQEYQLDGGTVLLVTHGSLDASIPTRNLSILDGQVS